MEIYDVFISYRRSDGAEPAQKLYEYLHEKMGLRVFLDKEEMITGKYFDEQIKQQVINTPNYIFIGTPDAFKFRTGETDYVAEEIKLAIAEYEKAPEDRVVLPILPDGLAFPDESVFPKGTEKLSKCDAIFLSGAEPTDNEYKKILNAVTAVSRRNLWNAGHRWLENSKKPGGRFAMLDIDATIMPKHSRKKKEQFTQLPINVYGKEKDSEGHESQTEEQPLLEALRESKGHLYLIGQGGIGKTTALISVMNDAYDKKIYSEDKPVPLFVELSRAPETFGRLYKGGVSTFIRREIYRQIRADKSVKQIPKTAVGELDKAFKQDPDAVVAPIDELLTKESSKPEYLLLLDGLNETSRAVVPEADKPVVTMIIKEIEDIIDNCPNVRVILTSRTDDTAISNDKISRLYLSGVDDDTIRSYLESKKLSRKRIDSAFADSNLIETIRIPLFLTMYASLKNADEVSTQGEIFRVFFSERRSNIETYTAQGRAEEAEEGISSQKSKKRVTAEMQSFILDFILPEIAWTMEREGKFYIDGGEIEDIIAPVLTEETPDRVCGRYGREVFARIKEGSKSRTRETAKKMRSKLGDMIEIAEAIRNCAIYSLCVMQVGEDGYGFMHHHIRDYFAAVRNVNSIRMAVYANEKKKREDALLCLAFLKDKPVSPEARRFIGEYLHEQRNAPILEKGGTAKYNVPEKPEDRNLIKRALDIFRERFDGGDGYSVYSLVNIIADVRGDLCGENLSRLDLRQCTFDGIKLGEKGCGASLKGGLFGENNVLPVGHSDCVNSASYGPDGKYIVTASDDKTVKVFDASTFALVKTIEGHSDCVNSASYSPDGKYIITASSDKTVKVWNASTFDLVKTLEGHSSWVNSASYSPDGKYIVTASSDKTVKVFDASTLSLVKTIEGHSRSVNNAAYSPDGKYIVTASDDSTVKVFDASTFSLVKAIEGHSSWVTSAAYSPDGKYIVTASGRTVKVFDASTFSLVKTIEGHSRSVNSASYSPDGKYIISASGSPYDKDYTIKVWDASTFSLVKTIDGHSWSVNSASYSPDGKYIVSASDDETVKVWDASNFSLVKTIEGRSDQVRSSTYSPDGKHIISASNDRTIKVWDASAFSLVKTLEGHSYWVRSASYSPDGKYIVSASYDKTVKVWDASTFSLVKTLDGHSDYVNSATYSPDGKYIISASGSPYSKDNTIKVWDASNFLLVKTIKEHSDSVHSAAYSPDGKYIVSASNDKTVKVWDASNFSLVKTIKEHSDAVISASYSPDGKYIVTASLDGTAKVFDASTFSLAKTLDEHSGWVTIASYSPNGKCIVSASNDKTVKIWDASTFSLVKTIEGHSDVVTSAAYSPDGKYIVSASWDGKIKIWDTSTFDCVETIPNIPGLCPIDCDLTSLHPSSDLSDKAKALLRRYGAKV